MKFLNSKEMSLFCFFVNCFFAASAFIAGEILWLSISMVFAGLCLYNYNIAKGNEQ